MKKGLLVISFVFISFCLFAQQAPGDNATSLRGNNGSTYTFTTTGTNDGSVWGGADGIYTDDSRLGKAAVHSGLLRVGQTGNVTITILSGRGGYQGNTQNGITSSNYGAWTGSYQFGAGQNVNQPQNNNPTVVSAPVNMTGYRGNNGSSYTFNIIGTNDGSVWGGADGIYTDDSKLGTAAVHAGLVGIGQSANIKVTVVQGQSGYKGSNQHGISSKDYGAWNGSYTFGITSQTNAAGVSNAPANLTAYRGNNGTLYTFRVTGTNDGSAWGGADGIYTDDSKLGTAAVHAGLVRPGETAIIKVRILQGQASYRGSNGNGITTKDYGAWNGSFRFER